MKEKLINLYNAMLLIETKGDSTILMSDCLKLLRQCILETDKSDNKSDNVKVGD